MLRVPRLRLLALCVSVSATSLVMAGDAYAMNRAPDCTTRGVVEFIQDHISAYTSDKVLSFVLGEAAEDLKRHNDIQNRISSAMALAILMMETQVELESSRHQIQRRRIPYSETGSLTYSEWADSRHYTRLKAKLSIQHDPKADWISCFDVATRALLGQTYPVAPSGALAGVDVQWVMDRDETLITWMRETNPLQVADQNGISSIIVFATTTDRDLSRVCVVPWERKTSVRLRYRIKANELEDLLTFAERVVRTVRGDAGSAVDLAVDLGSRSLWLESKPVEISVIDWKPCDWSVEVGTTVNMKQFGSAPVGSGSTRSLTIEFAAVHSFEGSGALEEASFTPTISARQTAQVNSKASWRISPPKYDECQDWVTGNQSSSTIDGSSGSAAVKLEILPEQGAFRFSVDAQPVPTLTSGSWVAEPARKKRDCRGGGRAFGPSAGSAPGPAFLFPVEGRLSTETNDIAGEYSPPALLSLSAAAASGNYSFSLPSEPGLTWSGTQRVIFRFKPLGNPAPRCGQERCP